MPQAQTGRRNWTARLIVAVTLVAGTGLAGAGVWLLLIVAAFTEPSAVTTDAGFGVRRAPAQNNSEATFFEVQERPVTFEVRHDARLSGGRIALSGIYHHSSPGSAGWPVMSLTLETDRPLTTMSSPRPVLTFRGDGYYSPHFRKKYPITDRNGTHSEPIDFVFDPARVIEVAREEPLVIEFDGSTINLSADDTAALVAFCRAMLTGTPVP